MSTHHGTHHGYVRIPSRHPRPPVARGLDALPLLAVNATRNGGTSGGSGRESRAFAARVMEIQALRDMVHCLNSSVSIQHLTLYTADSLNIDKRRTNTLLRST